MKLVLERRPQHDLTPTSESPQGGVLLMTPPVSEDYWMFRVKVSRTQAIIAFPKFFTIGIGFAVEEDWNTNLPYHQHALRIWSHIKHNKGDAKIPDSRCIKAIEILQAACAEYEKAGEN